MAASVTVSMGELSKRNLQLDALRQPCRHVNFGGDHLAVGRSQEDVVKGDGRLD